MLDPHAELVVARKKPNTLSKTPIPPNRNRFAELPSFYSCSSRTDFTHSLNSHFHKTLYDAAESSRHHSFPSVLHSQLVSPPQYYTNPLPYPGRSSMENITAWNGMGLSALDAETTAPSKLSNDPNPHPSFLTLASSTSYTTLD